MTVNTYNTQPATSAPSAGWITHKTMKKSLTSIANDLRDLVYDLEDIDLLSDDDRSASSEWQGVIECLKLGLPAIEFKYGYSSNEAKAVLMLIDKWG